ncbi:MAG: apolipoprotein N-acyltransferase [Paracoccaceae bacterium]
MGVLTRRPLLVYAAAFLLGALVSQALAPRHWLWAIPVGFGLLPVLLSRCETPARWGLAGWSFGLGYFALGLSWIIEPFQVDPDRHGWMAPFALFFLAGGLALFWAAAFRLAAHLPRQSWRGALVLAVVWSLSEYVRAYVFTGLPWAGFAQFWIDTPLAGVLAWVGPHGVGFVTVLAGLSLGHLFLPGHPVSKAVLVTVPVMVLGAVLMWPQKEVAFFDTTVRLIQPNAPQHQKWDPEFIGLFYQRQLSLSAAQTNGPAPDMIVWPETSVPVLLEDAGDVLSQISQTANGVPVLVGVQSGRDGKYFNSLVQVGPGGTVQGQYDKHHLVPFGEYLPLQDLMSQLGLSGLAAQMPGGFSPGSGAEVLIVDGIGTMLPLICYEAVFPQDINGAETRPDMLVQITNDAWFGTFSGPYQHLVQARMRAVEQGLPLMRAANTGVSAMIDPNGTITAMLPLGEVGFLDAQLPRPLAPTLYSRTGDWPVLVLLLLLGGVMTLLHARSARMAEPRNYVDPSVFRP